MRQFWSPTAYIAVAGVIVTLLGCAVTTDNPSSAAAKGAAPRNVILLIGDGMGPQQIALSELYWRRTRDERARPLNQFLLRATNGMHMPLPERSLVNDSACAASQLAGGCRCEPRQVGVDTQGVPCNSVLRAAKEKGLRVGIVSDTRITHATPAAFYGHVGDRDEEYQLAKQLVESEVDVALSGGADFFLPTTPQGDTFAAASASGCKQPGWGKRSDGGDLLAVAQARGSRVVCSGTELDRVRELPVLGLFSPGHMANAFREGEGSEPTLARMTERALELLDNSKGFFLMVEAGQIDTAGHYNDSGWVLAEMLRLSSVLHVVERFVEKHPDTLVLLTADHETGGMGLSYRRVSVGSSDSSKNQHRTDFLSEKNLRSVQSQTATIADIVERYQRTHGAKPELKALQHALAKDTGTILALPELAAITGGAESGSGVQVRSEIARNYIEAFYPYAQYSTAISIARRISAEQGVVWATGTHTTTPVNVLATGPMAEQFHGWFSTKELGEKLLQWVQ